jgi:hypothetical protein
MLARCLTAPFPRAAAIKSQADGTISGLKQTIQDYETQAAKLSTDLEAKITEVSGYFFNRCIPSHGWTNPKGRSIWQ